MTQRAVDAIAYAEAHPRWTPDMCLNFVRNALRIPALAPTAIAAWRDVPDPWRHSWYTPPVGVPVFWGGGRGHVALSAGGSKVWSTDILKRGRVSLVPISLIAERWGKQYLGWTGLLNDERVWP
jgi:hypothetical protein